MAADDIQGQLDLVDWRRRVNDLYRVADLEGVSRFREDRDRLFRDHPQSPLAGAEQGGFAGLDYFPASIGYRVAGTLDPLLKDAGLEIDTGGPDGVIHYRRVAHVSFRLAEVDCRLTVFSIVGYGGGLFLPFRDTTSGGQTYGGGRYLLDTIKGAIPVPAHEPGSSELVLDFNYAYNPSCAYDHRWACPLAPRENWLPVAVTAGEKAYAEGGA